MYSSCQSVEQSEDVLPRDINTVSRNENPVLTEEGT
jgi:hypothetical protein